ncbi:hypothetical protein IV203_029962 [Nitzschia inconspicua]|uniref:Uncharacterized protein n=1 Tax=Nitzschia inconspicua TaxID=303405 RepID=A0A9K3LV86_9STRA|nr:hypothetical protein IV203_029962 [Nitzschia inconspicua]
MAEEPRCMAGLPPTKELIALKIPYGAWEPDTLITDTYGNPIFSVLDVQHHAMGSFEAIFGDENGHKLCYVKRRLITKYWKDGWDFCTYSPNFPGQPKYKERDMYGKAIYPFSFLQVRPLRCHYAYQVHEEDLEGMDLQLEAMHGWLGSMTVCCTPMVRLGKWQLDFHRPGAGDPEINIDQAKNLLEVERGNDLLAALCIAYAFDKALCQPLVTIIGYQEKEHMDDDDESLDEFDPTVITAQKQYPRLANGLPQSSNYEDQPSGYDDTEEGYGYEEGYEEYDGAYDNNEYYNEDGSGYDGYDESYYNESEYHEGETGYDEYAHDDGKIKYVGGDII